MVSKDCPEYYFLDIPFSRGGGSAWDKERFEVIWEKCNTYGCHVRTTNVNGICCGCNKTRNRFLEEHEHIRSYYTRKRRR